MQRRSFLRGTALSLIIPSLSDRGYARPPSRPQVAITIDDFAMPSTGKLTIAERDAAIRKALKRHKIKAAGFITGKYIDNPEGQTILESWTKDGHILGNHSYTHRHYGTQDAAEYWKDFAKCEALLTPHSSFRKLIRFPYLAEGRSIEARDTIRRIIKENGYRNGVVTIDTSEWFIDRRMGERIKTKPGSTLAGYGKFYAEHLWDRAQYYDRLAKLAYEKSIPHTLLVHHNDITALFLDDALTMFKRKGWQLIDAEKAYQAPELQEVFNTMPSGQSIVWSAAKAKNVGGPHRYPGENGPYEAPRMDALGL